MNAPGVVACAAPMVGTPLPLRYPGNCSSFADLTSRLRAGRAISMLALGSSVTGVSGGCTAPVPGVCAENACPMCCGSLCGQWGPLGWARDVFERVNATWPHPRHALYNLGQPGGGLAKVAAACSRNLITMRVDVFFLELLLTGGGATAVRELARLLADDQRATYGHEPLIFLTNFDSVNWTRTRPHLFYDNRREFGRLAVEEGWPLYSTDSFVGRAAGARPDLWQHDMKHPKPRPAPLISTPIFEALRAGVDGCVPSSWPRRPHASAAPRHAAWHCLRFDKVFPGKREQAGLPSGGVDLATSSGWETVALEPTSRTKAKPGIRAMHEGARLELDLSAEVGASARAHGGAGIRCGAEWCREAREAREGRRRGLLLRAEFLSTYEGHGDVHVECVRCECAPLNVSSTPRPPAQRVSVSASFDLKVVNPAGLAACRVAITAIRSQRTRSAAFKFISFALTHGNAA